MKYPQNFIFVTAALLALLTACGGGSDTQATINDPASAATPAGGSVTLVTCTPPPIAVGVSRYTRVFKDCNSNGVHQYYELDECVLDTTTGLIWQGQTPAGTGLRANDQYKTNFDNTSELQIKFDSSGWYTPIPAEINAVTNTIGFKNAVNLSNLCGANNWRLPTRDELAGLIKQSETPKIDNAAFPNTQSIGYWTSTPTDFADAAWSVLFGFGGISIQTRNGGYLGFGSNKLVRLVR